MSIKNELISRIIPPATREFREDFDNTHVIDKLNDQEKDYVEDELLKLTKHKFDLLVIETLLYLKSKKAVAVFKRLLKVESNLSYRILLASAIYELDSSNAKVEDIAINAFNKLEDKYSIGLAFYDLAKFNSSKVIRIIKNHFNHGEFYVSYHAKESLRSIS